MSGFGPETAVQRNHAGPPLMPGEHSMSGSGPESTEDVA